MSNKKTATGRRDVPEGEQLATKRDVAELFTNWLAEYHEAHVYDIRIWVEWKSLPIYERIWLKTKLAFQEEWRRVKSAWNWLKSLVGWAKKGP
jgi:hypothetical protein